MSGGTGYSYEDDFVYFASGNGSGSPQRIEVSVYVCVGVSGEGGCAICVERRVCVYVCVGVSG